MKKIILFLIIINIILVPKSVHAASSEAVLDIDSGRTLVCNNCHEKRLIASITKIMTATVVIENSNLNDIVNVSSKAAGTGGSRIGLHTNDKISVNDLLYGLMLYSGNDTAVALAEHVGGSVDGFAEMMNKKAEELHLINTSFKTPHGLDKEGHYTTAYELALLSDYALHNETFAKIVNTKTATITINGNPKTVNNTNELLGNLNGVYGIKTGFTNGANRCLVTACKRNDLDIICVVLGADTKKFRTTDSTKLIEYTFSNFTKTNISEIIRSDFDKWKNENLNSFNIYKSTADSEPLDLKLCTDCDDVIIPIKNSEIKNITTEINCETNLVPPISSNTVLGKISAISEGNVICTQNILLANNIYKKSFLEYFFQVLKKLPV